LWLCLLFWISLISAQATVPNTFAIDGFNITSQVVNNLMEIRFFALDTPTSVYTLRLTQVFEGMMVNGRVVPKGPNLLLPTMVYTITPITNTMSYNISVTVAPPAATATGLQNLAFTNAYWFKSSNKNVCPDANGRFCIKFTAVYQYIQTAANSMLVFVWDLLDNQVFASTTNPTATKPQVLNNLAFLTVEPATTNTDTTGQFIPSTQTVTVQMRTDNITSNGIWVIYNLGQPLNVHVTHDPIFGINTGQNLTLQIVTTALSIGIVVAFLAILGCSIYIYHGNTKSYYRKLRVVQEDE